MRSPVWISFLLVAGVFAVYYPVAGHEFVHYDDYEYVVQNAQLRDSLSEALPGAFRPYAANWIPLTWMSLWLDFALYGLEPAGYHLTNVALHALSCVLLFLALARMTGAIWRSAFVAAVFAIHPLHVESVAWATERKDTLSGAFWMLTLWAYARYSKRAPSAGSYLLVLLCLSLGLLAKPVVVTLPFVLLLLDYWPLGRLRESDEIGWPQAVMLRRALVEKLPMFALVALASAATWMAQREMGALYQMEDLSTAARVANATVSYVIYLWKAVWPSGLAAFYPHPLEGIVDWRPVAAFALLIAITAALARTAAAHSYAVVGWLWYLGTLVPVIGFVQVGMQARADRYTYIPLIGLAILTAWGSKEWAQRWRIPLAALGAVAIAAIVVFATMARFQVRTWRDTESLYRHALSVTEGNYLAHNGMGSELARRERFAEATWHYEEAVRMAPQWSTARLGLADVALASGRVDEAIHALKKELERNPNAIEVIGRYGIALGLAGRFGEAHHFIERALAARPGIGELHRAMADVEAARGNTRAAIHHGREALRLQPDDLGAANNLAWALATNRDASLRDPHEAIRLLEGAARASSDPWVLDTLAAAYASAGLFNEAVATASRAVHLAREQGADANLHEIRSRLALYQQSKPYVDPGAGTR